MPRVAASSNTAETAAARTIDERRGRCQSKWSVMIAALVVAPSSSPR